MNTTRSAFAAFLLAFAAAGCAANAGPDSYSGEPGPEAVVKDAPFMQPTTLAVSIEGSQAELDQMTMPIVAGTLALSATGPDVVSLDRLEIDVSEVELPQSNLQGMKLEQIKVRLENPTLASVQTSDSGTRFASIETTLVVDWKLVTQLGATVPLATQRFEGVKFDLGIYRTDDGKLVADLYGGKEGSLGQWAGIGELDDLLFDIHAVE